MISFYGTIFLGEVPSIKNRSDLKIESEEESKKFRNENTGSDFLLYLQVFVFADLYRFLIVRLQEVKKFAYF